MSPFDENDVDWELTHWDGSRKDQLRRARELTLRERLQAVEEMGELSERLRMMREARRPSAPIEGGRPKSDSRAPDLDERSENHS